MEWQWHQVDHMQIICTSLQTDNYASTSPLSFYGSDALPAPNQQRQSTENKWMFVANLCGLLVIFFYFIPPSLK